MASVVSSVDGTTVQVLVEPDPVITVLVPGPQGSAGTGTGGSTDLTPVYAAIADAKKRANHTGVQTVSTISGLTAYIRSVLVQNLLAGSNVTVTDDGTNVIIASTGGSGSMTTQQVQEIVGAMVRAGAGASVTYASGLVTIVPALRTVAGRTGDVVVGTDDLANFQESVEDLIAGMLNRGTQQGLSVIYDDNGAGPGSLSFVSAASDGSGGVVSTTTDRTLGKGEICLVSAAANLTLTLPSPVLGARCWAKRTDATNFTITVATPSGTIDGQTTVDLPAQYVSQAFVADGTNWYLL